MVCGKPWIRDSITAKMVRVERVVGISFDGDRNHVLEYYSLCRVFSKGMIPRGANNPTHIREKPPRSVLSC